jgi:hypothetical protein
LKRGAPVLTFDHYGTQEILKNAVAERMLGLPRDVDPTTSLPWSETRRKAVRRGAPWISR